MMRQYNFVNFERALRVLCGLNVFLARQALFSIMFLKKDIENLHYPAYRVETTITIL